MTKVVFIVKTDLNTDGRILNELRILKKADLDLKIDLILFPDKPLTINIGDEVNVHQIKTLVRNYKIVRLFTGIQFALKALFLLIKLRPEIIHAQDSSIVLPVLIYRLFNRKNHKLIYDDHEMPNENASRLSRANHFAEVLLMKRADSIIFANQERMDILKKKHRLKTQCSYFLNLPYFEGRLNKNLEADEEELIDIDRKILKGTKFIIHQGPLEVERGRKKLAEFSKTLPEEYKILLLGGNKHDYVAFIKQYNLNENNFYFRGSVNYYILPKYWDRGIASIVMYLPTYTNNRLCAPNRFYISIQKRLPVIVNKENPVLSNFINQYKCGLFLDMVSNENLSIAINEVKIPKDMFVKLKDEQIDNFISIYKSYQLDND